MTTDIWDEALRLRALFEEAGAATLSPPILLPAATLLDLYGEDIRGRAYVTSDALRGEQMLRPDFTVPVVEMHMLNGAEPAQYTYAGVVFRRQDNDIARANEYLQVGYEVFDRRDPVAVEAGVFARFDAALAGLDLRASVGDIGILMAAVAGLETSARRKAALMRHIWRPARFRALLHRFAGLTSVPPERAALLDGTAPHCDAPQIGLRSLAEINERVTALREDALEPPLRADDIQKIETILAIRAPLPAALKALRDIGLRNIDDALERFETRIKALTAHGIDCEALTFEGSYGRTQMEYYDGFVFGFYATDHDGLPPVATGGRYDTLTQRLGKGDTIPAVGGALRPDLILSLRGRA